MFQISMRTSWCAVCALLVLVPAAAASQLDRAEAAWQAGDIRAAVLHLKSLLDEEPGNVRARLLQARLDLALLDAAQAENAARRALTEGADREAALPLLGDALLAQKRFQDVLDEISPAAGDRDALRSNIARIRAEALRGLRRDDEASKQLDIALTLDPGNARALVVRALDQLEAGDLPGARGEAQHAADVDPQLPEAWDLLALMARRSGDLPEAERLYGMAILNRSADWLPRYQRALTRIAQGKLDAAEQDIDLAERQVPRFVGMAYARGRIALARGDAAEALPLLQRYVEAVPDDIEAVYFTGVALMQLQRWGGAEEHLRQVLEVAPGSMQAAMLLARLRLRAGDPAAAEALLQPVTARPDAPEQASVLLVQALLAQGRGNDTLDLLARLAAAHPDDSRFGMAHAQQLAAAGERDDAIAELRRVIATEPEAKAARLLLIRLLAQGGDTAAARTEAQALSELAPDDPTATNALAVTLALSGERVAARVKLRDSTAQHPGALEPALNLARLALADGDTDAARAAVRGVLEADAGNVRAAVALAELLAREGDRDGAAAHLAKTVKAQPDNLPLRLTAAGTLMRLDQPDLAEELLAAAPAAQLDTPALLSQRGVLALRDGRNDDALGMFERLGALRPDAAAPFYLQARALAGLGRAAEARDRAIRALRSDAASPLAVPTLLQVLHAMPSPEARQEWLDFLGEATGHAATVLMADARNAIETGNRTRASSLLEAMREEQPGNRAVVMLLIANERERGNPGRARQLAESWLWDHPNDNGIRLALAEMALAQDNTDAAIFVYEMLVQGEQPVPVAYNNLAWLLRETNPRRARTLAEKAHELVPDNADYADTLASILLAAGEPNTALPLLEAARKQRPADPGIAFHYAHALADTGRPDQARRVLLEIRGRSFPEQAAAIALLERLRP